MEEWTQEGGEGIKYKIFKELMDLIHEPIKIKYNSNGSLNEDVTINQYFEDILKKNNNKTKLNILKTQIEKFKTPKNPKYNKYSKYTVILNKFIDMINEAAAIKTKEEKEEKNADADADADADAEQSAKAKAEQEEEEKKYQIVQINIKPKQDLLQETISLLMNQKFITTYTAVFETPIIIDDYKGETNNLIQVTKFKACTRYLYSNYKNNYSYYHIPETQLPNAAE